ncbi:cation:proton antiporter [Candidatus Micrarchaeota archaeon]|nr:cation:proton antiporter [Candidatus Micrarchaeota archaeon]
MIRASLFTSVDEHKRIWFEISFLLITAILAELLVVYIKQPFVMSLLIVGVLISPSFISLTWPFLSNTVNSIAFNVISLPLEPPKLVAFDEIVRVFAQLGAIILLFKIGLHSEIKKIFTFRNMVVAALGIIIPFAGGYYYATLTGEGSAYALFLGAALTATSVGVTVAILEEFKLLEREFSKIILGAAVIDDILSLLVLSFVSTTGTGTFETLLPILFSAFIFVVGGIFLGQLIVSRYFNTIEEEVSNRIFLAAMVYVFAYAYIAEFIGLSSIIGAFIAGVTLNYSKIANSLLKFISPLENFFTPIFFISLGLLVDVNALGDFLIPILIVTGIAILSKLIACGVVALGSGLSFLESLIVGFGMVPRGEIALIIALYGLTSGILSPSQYSVITAMAFLTTFITPPIIQTLVSKTQ